MDALGFTRTLPTPTPEMPETEAWRTVLLDAAVLIERAGWIRGGEGYSFGRTTGPVCIVGAIYRNGRFMVEAIDAINRWCQPGASFWNDHVATNAAEVCATLRACARS